MAIGLFFEGIMSACYHVCPSRRNFQFDTTFMYVIAILNVLKIYEGRHPDINPHAYTTFSFLALVILAVVVGAYFSISGFWYIMAAIHGSTCIVLATKVYYMSRLKFNSRILAQLWYLMSENGLCTKPRHLDRFILIVIFILTNIGYAIYRVLDPPNTLADHLVFVCLGNLAFYLVWYVMMKMHYREPFTFAAKVSFGLASVLWSSSFFLFNQKLKSWNVEPATSRSLNANCILFNFYDIHDLWHLVSSLAIFFTFLAVMTIDDGIRMWKRDQIHVF
ncbi:hypothetical protein ACOME3_010648 [Neoechinorhynchus agilis]